MGRNCKNRTLIERKALHATYVQAGLPPLATLPALFLLCAASPLFFDIPNLRHACTHCH